MDQAWRQQLIHEPKLVQRKWFWKRSNPIQHSGSDNVIGLGGVIAPDPTLLNHWAWTHRWRNSVQSREHADRVLELQQDNVGPASALANRTLAWHARWIGNFDAAESLCLISTPQLEHLPDKDALADTYAIRAIINCHRGNLTSAKSQIATGQALLTPQSAMATRIDLLVANATLHRYLGAFDGAFSLLQEGLAFARGAEMAYLRYSISRAKLFDGQYPAAADAAQLALTAATRFDNRLAIPPIQATLAICHLRHGLLDQSENSLAEGMSAATDNQDPFSICVLTAIRAEIALKRGQRSFAQELIDTLHVLEAKNGFTTSQFEPGREVLDHLNSHTR